jgi:hypothetical protein
VLLGEAGQGFVVDTLVSLADAVVDHLEEAAGEIGLVAVGQVTAMAQVHREQFIAGLEHGKVDGHVGAAARVGLNIGVRSAKELFGTVDGQLLGLVDHLASAIPTLARITLGVFVGQHRPLRLHHRRAGEVLAGNELDVFLLPQSFAAKRVGNLGIDLRHRRIG